MRVAVIDRDKCYSKKCSQECIHYCPRVRSGDETIVMDEKTGKPVISEELCVGCGICVHKCPFNAIHIENLADELEKDMVHRFGENEFRLFRLPVPKKGKVVGILGQNPPEDVLEYWKGTDMYEYMSELFSGNVKVAFSPAT